MADKYMLTERLVISSELPESLIARAKMSFYIFATQSMILPWTTSIDITRELIRTISSVSKSLNQYICI